MNFVKDFHFTLERCGFGQFHWKSNQISLFDFANDDDCVLSTHAQIKVNDPSRNLFYNAIHYSYPPNSMAKLIFLFLRHKFVRINWKSFFFAFLSQYFNECYNSLLEKRKKSERKWQFWHYISWDHSVNENKVICNFRLKNETKFCVKWITTNDVSYWKFFFQIFFSIFFSIFPFLFFYLCAFLARNGSICVCYTTSRSFEWRWDST